MKLSCLLFMVVLSACYQSGSSCRDYNKNCGNWIEHCKTNTWMKDNCAKTCDSCVAEVCKDKDTNCPYWANDYCEDGYWGKWMAEKCPKSCDKCPVTVTTVAPDTRDTCLCGLAKGKQRRIVGGTEIKINEYPWLVLLTFKTYGFQGGKAAHAQCGGTLINDRWVLSAAHCVASQNPNTKEWKYEEPSSVQIVLGEHDFSRTDETESIKRKVKQIVTHSDYMVESQYDYDFALLELEDPVDFTKYKHIRPACLPQTTNTGPDPDQGMVGDFATVAGWGHTQDSRDNWAVTNSDFAQQVHVKVQSMEECRKNYKEEINKNWFKITSRMVCAAVNGGGKDSCQNDSGGPLIWSAGDGRTQGQNYEVKGVVSFGMGCAKAGQPGVYAKVSYVLPWIEEIAKSGKTCPRTNK